MIEAIKFLLGEANQALIQPRLHKAKVDFKLALVTGGVIALFSLLAMVCLFLLVFLSIASATSPTEAAVILFGVCVIMIVGAILAHILGRKAEQKIFEKRFARFNRPISFPEGLKPTIQAARIGQGARQVFAANKLAALAGVTILGVLFGARPATAVRTASKLVLGKARGRANELERDGREYRRRR